MNRRRSILLLGLPVGLAALALILALTALPAQAMGGTLNGQVTSPAGYPLPPGTVVKLFDPGEVNLFGQAGPDPNNGSFALGPVPNGLYLLKAVPPPGSGLTQSQPELISVVNNPVTGIQLALTEPQIEGLVLAPDGVSPAEAFVHVFAGDGQLLQHVPAPGGEFLVGGLPAGGYWLRAFPAADDPYWRSSRLDVNIPGLIATQAVTLTLVDADLYGYAMDEEGVPVPNAAVVAAHGTGDGQVDHASVSGYWAIGGLLTETTYTLVALPPEENIGLLPTVPLTLTLPDPGSPYTLTLGSPPKIVQGEVRTNTGAPVENALVTARRVNKAGSAETTSNPAGAYELNLTPGLWALTVQPLTDTVPEDWVSPAPPQLIHFQHNNDPETHVQNFSVLTADAEVIGAVEMPDGAAPPFTVTVGLHNDEGIGRRTLIDPVDGTFALTIPNGGYKVAVHPEDPGYLGPVVEPVMVEPEGVLDLGILTLVAKDAMITGTVTDEGGNDIAGGTGVAGIPIVAWRPGAPGSQNTHTGPDGTYALAVTGEGWHVQPAPGPEHPYLYTGPGARVEAPVGGVLPDIDFTLIQADATIGGVLVDEGGNPVNDVDGWATAVNITNEMLHNGAPITHGLFKIHVPAGTYNVAAHLPAGSPYLSTGERRVTVGAGETIAVALVVKEKDAVIAGALVGPSQSGCGRRRAWTGRRLAGPQLGGHPHQPGQRDL